MFKVARVILPLAGLFLIDDLLAQGYLVNGGGFESKMNNLTNKLVTVLLPMMSLVGLIYACILAMTGDGAGRQRILMVIACSIIGFLAPVLIAWLQSIMGY